jgi:hypothetical protein
MKVEGEQRSRIKYIPPTSERARGDSIIAGAHSSSPQVYDGFGGFKRSSGMKWAKYGRLSRHG